MGPEGSDALYLEDLKVGQRFKSGTHTVDAEEIKAFARQFDPQPFHLDEHSAKDTFFGSLAASGWHVAAMTMRLLVDGAAPFAGGVIGGGGEIAWPKPTRPGDALHVESEVVEITPSRSRPNRGMVSLRCETRNQHGDAVQILTAKLVCRGGRSLAPNERLQDVRILVVGAGALGGYFGGRLLQAGRDVTFLVRPRRAEALAKLGLRLKSSYGDFLAVSPPTVTQERLVEPFDLVLVSCKAYDLEAAMASFAKAVGPGTAILPLLNGMRHLDVLVDRFGAERVLGGLCIISATLDAEGGIVHLNDLHGLTFGELDGSRSTRIEAVASALSGAVFDAQLSDAIRQDMWEKWLFIAGAAGITCLMRASVGEIVAAGAADLATALIDECADIATRQGFPPRPASLQRARAALTAPGSPLTASMLRDIEGGMPVEGEQILGDLLRRGEAADGFSLLRIAYAHVKAYEARRKRGEPAADRP